MADLCQLQFRSLDVLGGASRVTLTLPDPTGTVFVHVVGGISDLIIRRSPSVALGLQVRGGVSSFAVDEQQVIAVGAERCWESVAYACVTDRYDISIGGGASNVLVDTCQSSPRS